MNKRAKSSEIKGLIDCCVEISCSPNQSAIEIKQQQQPPKKNMKRDKETDVMKRSERAKENMSKEHRQHQSVFLNWISCHVVLLYCEHE